MANLGKLLLRLLGFWRHPKTFIDRLIRVTVLVSDVISFAFCLVYVFNTNSTAFASVRALLYVYSVLHVSVVYLLITGNSVLADCGGIRKPTHSFSMNLHILIEAVNSALTVWHVCGNLLLTESNGNMDNLSVLPAHYVMAGEVFFSVVLRLRSVMCYLVISSSLDQLAGMILCQFQMSKRRPLLGNIEGVNLFLIEALQFPTTDRFSVDCVRTMRTCDRKLHKVLTVLIVLVHVEYFVALVIDFAIWISEDLNCGYVRPYAILYNASQLHMFLMVVSGGEAVDRSLWLARRKARRRLVFGERLELRVFLRCRYPYISTPNWQGCCTFIAICWSFALLVIQSAMLTTPKCSKPY